ncbi:O-unit flippase-like protein [Roseateles depolymerans]|uniref:Uncharacterized protein n=1 Tax=Roseateles depolymerans TaxID=76731 RepID=A0A0U3N8M2_9BURK|nr:O-unit flippase-like protein [Roseateles depolymerans]ALV08491.1 hypothetical protein RD2015_4042 [Roseateles depolymerans]REG21283.1 O-antigen/teichoic acid export membrane protein [Roseateles depolymerans]
MNAAKPRSELKWGYFAQALNIGAGLLLLPAVVRSLPSEDVGIWFVFMTLTSLAQLLELGFLPTIARNTAYLFAGARSLAGHGLPTDMHTSGQVDPGLLADLTQAARRIYRWVALLGGLILMSVGSLYVLSVMTPTQDRGMVLGAWWLYAAGNICNFYYGYVNGLLQGRGDVVAANQVVIVTRASMLAAGILALSAGGGLLGLGAATFLASVSGRFVAMRFFRRGAIALPERSRESIQHTVQLLWHNASRLGVVQVGAFLIQRANVLVASSFLGVSAAASLGLTVTLLMTLSGVAAVILQVRMPRLASAQATRDIHALRGLYGEVLLIACGAFLAGLLVMIVAGNWCLQLLHSKTLLLPTPLLCWLGLIMLLELNHSLAAGYLTTRNQVPFVRAGLLSGVLICLSSLALVKPFGVAGLIAAQGVVQLAYNNWKWPREARLDLGVGWLELLSLGFQRILGRRHPHADDPQNVRP